MQCQNCLSRELRSELGVNEQYSSTKVICKCMIFKHCAKCNKGKINSIDFVSTNDIHYKIFYIHPVIFIDVDLIKKTVENLCYF